VSNIDEHLKFSRDNFNLKDILEKWISTSAVDVHRLHNMKNYDKNIDHLKKQYPAVYVCYWGEFLLQ